MDSVQPVAGPAGGRLIPDPERVGRVFFLKGHNGPLHGARKENNENQAVVSEGG